MNMNGNVLAEFQYDHTEVVPSTATILSIFVQGPHAGVYYFETPEVGRRSLVVVLRASRLL
jgi:hypothetical protein